MPAPPWGESMGISDLYAGRGRFCGLCGSAYFQSFCQRRKTVPFSLAYGSQRPYSSTWTVTGSGAVVLEVKGDGNWKRKETGYVQIAGLTTGVITDYGIKDSMNMGACMKNRRPVTVF